MSDTCKTCKHWAVKEAETLSECRKCAPTRANDDGLRIWPQTYAIDFCSDYERDYKSAAGGTDDIKIG